MARLRALLLERLTVLTRSVDTNGADFLVELRGGGRFSDELAPRLGIVQAKFAQDDATSHDIAPAYATDDGTPIEEFFVLVTVGNEDSITYHLLTGSGVGALPRVRRKGKEMHVLSAKDRKPFRKRKVSGILDRIERSLQSGTEAQNERFLRSVNIPDFELRRGALAATWLLPIPNEHGYIPDIVYRLRVALRTQLYAFDSIVDAISRLIKATNATDCVTALDDLLANRSVKVQAPGARIRFELSRVEEERAQLAQAVRTHSARTKALRKARLMDTFLGVAAAILQAHLDFIDAHDEPELVRIDGTTQRLSDKHALTRVTLDPVTGVPTGATTTLVPAGTAIVAAPYTLERSRELWRFGFEGGATTWRELDRLLHELMADHYRLLFPAEVVGTPVLPVIMAE
jgi:hypothetical protein